jgi:hypothetical protein
MTQFAQGFGSGRPHLCGGIGEKFRQGGYPLIPS